MAPKREEDKTEIRKDETEEAFPCLEVIGGVREGSRFPLHEGKNRIGRSADNEIILEDSSISRHHAVIALEGQGATVADAGSRNGTKVDGRKILQSVPLSHGATLQIGLCQLRFLAHSAETVTEAKSAPPLEEKEEVPPEEAEAPAEEAALPVVEETTHEPEPATVRKTPIKTSRQWILIAGLAVALIAAGYFLIPKMVKFHFFGKKTAAVKTKEKESKPGQVGGVLPGEKVSVPSSPGGMQPVFLDFSSAPIPAQIFFGQEQMGVTPFRTSTNLAPGKWYEARALFQLPEVGEVVEEKTQFTMPEGASVIPISFSAKIGIYKITAIPKDSQLYLEGYFEKDPYRAKPIKFAEIVFGKPIYVPFGRYIVELRKSRQLGNSQTFMDQVVYRREFYLNADQSTYTFDVKEDDLKTFPVQITSVPFGAKVFIDEHEVGVTPFTGSFPIGEHLLTLKHDGYFDFVQVIKMEINMPYVAEIPLKTSEAGEWINKADALMKDNRYPEALPILAEALSKKPSAHETAQISYMIGICYMRQKSYKEAQDYFLKAMDNEDYKYMGRLGIANLTFEQGDTVKALQLLVEVLVSSEDPKVRSDAGILFQRISPLKSVMYVTSEPSGARVLVNGAEVGQMTPLILHDLGVGSYRIQIQREGYEPTEMKLNLGVSEFRPVVAKLKPLGGP